MTVLSIKSSGWFIWANFLDTVIDTVLDGLKSTNQSLAHRVIIPRSVFKNSGGYLWVFNNYV